MNQSDPAMPNLESIPDGDLVLYCSTPMTKEGHLMLVEYFKKELPDRKVLVLDDRVRLESIDSSKQLHAIEEKIDSLLALVATNEGMPIRNDQSLSGFIAGVLQGQ